MDEEGCSKRMANTWELSSCKNRTSTNCYHACHILRLVHFPMLASHLYILYKIQHTRITKRKYQQSINSSLLWVLLHQNELEVYPINNYLLKSTPYWFSFTSLWNCISNSVPPGEGKELKRLTTTWGAFSTLCCKPAIWCCCCCRMICALQKPPYQCPSSDIPIMHMKEYRQQERCAWETS